uniref:Putative ovule protein n=1 Tax=Solanum chacoense TaxID=4108 RepID=A0A0V0GQ33_SOLCH
MLCKCVKINALLITVWAMDMKKNSTRSATLRNEHCNARIQIFRAPMQLPNIGWKRQKKEKKTKNFK